jgi:nitrite reductase (NADH) small subunit
MSERGWVPVGRAGDVPELEGRSVQFGTHRVAIFRLPSGWAAVDHRCPHQAGPLSDGLVADTCVTCPLHGWRFDLRTGERQGGPERLATYAVRERDGLLELRVSDEPALAKAA